MIALATSGEDFVRAGNIGLFLLNEGSGQTINDTGGSGNHGFLGTDVTVEASDADWVTEGLDFDGTEQARAPDSLNGLTAFTAQVVYAKTATLGANGGLIGHIAGGSYIRFLPGQDRVTFNLDCVTTDKALSEPALTRTDDGSWRMVSVRYNTGDLQDVFLNNGASPTIEATSAFATGAVNTGLRSIGSYAGGSFFIGKIAARLDYNRVLTVAEMQQNYRVLKALLGARGIALP